MMAIDELIEMMRLARENREPEDQRFLATFPKAQRTELVKIFDPARDDSTERDARGMVKQA